MWAHVYFVMSHITGLTDGRTDSILIVRSSHGKNKYKLICKLTSVDTDVLQASRPYVLRWWSAESRAPPGGLQVQHDDPASMKQHGAQRQQILWLRSQHTHGEQWLSVNCWCLLHCLTKSNWLLLTDITTGINFVFQHNPQWQQCVHTTYTVIVQCESKKVAPLKLFAIFSLRLRIYPWNFAGMLPVYIYTYLLILVDLS